MVSSNRAKANMTLNEEGSAACIALTANKYLSDIKYLTSSVQHQKLH
jgi:hypothetical protein